MRRRIKILACTLFCVVLISGCKKGFLETEMIGKLGIVELFSDVDGAKLGLNGSYNRVAYYYANEFGLYGDVAGDELNQEIRSGRSILDNEFNFQSTAGDDEFTVGHIWLEIFEALNNTNNVINNIPQLKTKYPDQSVVLDSILGQALILRAICHFDLSRVYSQTYTYQADAGHLGVPVLLKTTSPGEPVSRRTLKDTYAQIIKDINEGIVLLKKYKTNGPAFANYTAGWALLSRVYLYMGDWDKTKSYADSVIHSEKYALTPAGMYAAMYRDWNAGPEVIWQLNVTKYSVSSLGGVYSNGDKYQYYPAKKLLGLFDAEDIRGTQTIKYFKDDKGVITGRLSAKYGNEIVNNAAPFSVKVVRLSEMYLNRAEAYWNQKMYTEAAEDLRLISQRAHPNSTITITYASPEDLFQQISDERRRELCFEGHRFYDIARRHENIIRGDDSNSSVKQLTYPNNRFVLPIPSKELDANPAMQPNPGINN
ncbi:RagB/SusD family nutrient uptake outer membrane protein [Arcticibacter tournemirensis]|uniref:RagB/SusD family nutrient uptake outer membrane protein n=1 Tax=Arcticibacter tournemirensis TaxID=699437 RepID=A0A4Q0M5P7_9SPHI|nr:RagB/SusD family nutrient uptake outer membrane protein [Arcticibacter tournemirensis]RXF68327.1 RagB/SusD family nutrient uptake outer membrane protein [Arcticibacter tournemirensis]